jgi:hypothetical protein
MNTDARRRAILLGRLRDYEIQDNDTLTRTLADKWRAHFPLAAAEASSYLHPLVRLEEHRKNRPDDPDEIWHNDLYHVSLRRRDHDPVFGSKSMIQIGIASIDGTARHDWRDFQAIKNQLAGPECEAFELYPAEARLLDPSNYYTLWCFPHVKRIKVGHELREVRPAGEAMAPQRELPKGDV